MRDREDELLLGRRVRVSGEIDHASAERTIMQLLYLQSRDPRAPVTIEVDSGGGVFDDCLAIYDVMRYVKLPVHTRCTRVASGGAVLVFAAGTRGFRTADQRASFQLVPCLDWTGINDPNELARSHTLFVRALAACCDTPADELMRWLESSRRLTAIEAAALGIADYVHGGTTS